MNQVEGMPLTIGLAIAIIMLLFGFGGFIWAVASIRKADRDEIHKEIVDSKNSVINALNRLEKKTDENYSVLHGRVNKQVEEERTASQTLGYLTAKTEDNRELIMKLLDRLK